jgi:peptide/nickel transport system permease protein
MLTETVFGWPGTGRLMYEAIAARDYPVMMGNFIITSISVIVASMITDVVYAFLDPRIRYR